MWAALLLGLASGLAADWLADWLPPRIVNEEDEVGKGSAPEPGGDAIRPRAAWRIILLLGGSIAIAAYLHFAYQWRALFWTRFTLSELLLLIAVIDLEHRLVPNVLVAAGLVLSLLFSGLGAHAGLGSTLTGAVVAGLLFLLIAIVGRGALGPGDVKLAALIGAVNGFPAVLQALVIGTVAGGLAAAALLVTRLRGRKQFIPYAPYLVAGCLSTMLFGAQLAQWWARVPAWGG